MGHNSGRKICKSKNLPEEREGEKGNGMMTTQARFEPGSLWANSSDNQTKLPSNHVIKSSSSSAPLTKNSHENRWKNHHSENFFRNPILNSVHQGLSDEYLGDCDHSFHCLSEEQRDRHESKRETGRRQWDRMALTETEAAQPSRALSVCVHLFEEDHWKGQITQAHLRRSQIRDAFKISYFWTRHLTTTKKKKSQSLRAHSVTPLLTTSD